MATDLEVFRDTTSHRRPARLLYKASFTPDLRRRLQAHVGADKNIFDHYGFFQAVAPWPVRPDDLPKPDYSRYYHGENLPPGTKFNTVGAAQVPSGFYHFFGYVSPLRNATSLKEIEDYPLDDVTRFDYSHIPAMVKDAHAAGKAVCITIGHIYENAWQIRGYEQFLMDMIDQPAWAECLLERLLQRHMVLATVLAKAGVDMLGTGDDVANQKAMMFSPDMWRTMIHSRWAKLWGHVKRIHPAIKLWYHTDGNAMDIIGDMVDAGLDILNPLQPEALDVDAVHKKYGHVLSFDGCMGTQSTMPWGTPQQVKDRVKECIDKYGRNGGLILSPTHILEPEVPIANIEAFAEACREYRQ